MRFAFAGANLGSLGMVYMVAEQDGAGSSEMVERMFVKSVLWISTNDNERKFMSGELLG
jgi:hypothetical protein